MKVSAILGQDPVAWDSGAPGHPPNVSSCLILELNGDATMVCQNRQPTPSPPVNYRSGEKYNELASQTSLVHTVGNMPSHARLVVPLLHDKEGKVPEQSVTFTHWPWLVTTHCILGRCSTN